jgi:hypothetical protein
MIKQKVGTQALQKYGTLLLKVNCALPHYLQLRRGRMQHYVEEIHFLNQEVLTKATDHRYMQYLLGYECPGKKSLDQITSNNNTNNP